MFKNHPSLFFLAVFILFSFNCLAQQNASGYINQWKNIDGLIKKGLTRSAFTETGKIYEQAKKEGNDVQLIRSLLYKLNLNQDLQEDADVKDISTVEKEIEAAKQPAKSILQSISAGMYRSFFQQNRWKLYNRTNTGDFVKTDIRTWTIDDFNRKTGELYLASVKEEKILQQTSLDKYDPILVKGNVRNLRPSLYDLLANEALQYFKSDERDINRPAYAFEINDENAFANATEFAKHKFINKDSGSLHYYAIIIYQKLLAFHAGDLKPDALIDADISRLEFIYQYSVINNKDEWYIQALKNIESLYPANSTAAQAGYLWAQKVFSKANDIKQINDSTLRYTIAGAKNEAGKVAEKFPENEGGINAKNLLTQILHKEISLTSEKVNIPGKPFRTLVTYKNTGSVYLRIIELTAAFKSFRDQNDNNDQLWQKLVAQGSMRSWKQDLPEVNDFKSHSAEIKIDALPVGEYALLSSVSEDFILDKNPLAVQYFNVSGISFMNNRAEYFVLNRETGKPLPDAKVQVWTRNYDYKSGKNLLQKQEMHVTDKNGYFRLKDIKDKNGKIQTDDRDLRLEITYNNDRLFLDNYLNSYRYNDNTDDIDEGQYKNQQEYDKEKAKIFLFTDRGIYRPGQLVYFKGIGITKDIRTHRSVLLTEKDSIEVMLSDANDQRIDSMMVMLNEYGSLNGIFRLPVNKLNGEFSISVKNFDDAASSFSVEEYKRPKFYAEFEKVKGTYRVNDKIQITGFAKAFAGNNIDGATIKYRVTRVARFLYSWMFWRYPMPRTQPLEITHGEIKSGNDGKFSIAFEAIPDLAIDRNTDPVFDYKIEADVTDINGETRSASTAVPVGYKALDLQLTLPQPDAINVDSLEYLSVNSKNLSGEFEPTSVEVKIYNLQAPNRLIRTRYWQQPDQFTMSREAFLHYFPNDDYADDEKKESWPRGEIVFSKTDSTTPAGTWKLPGANFSQGWYVAEVISKDKYGQEVKDVKYFQLYDLKTASLPATAYNWNTTVKNNVEPGEKATFISGSSANDIFIIQQVDRQSLYALPAGDRSTNIIPSGGTGFTTTYHFFTLNNEKKTFDFPVKEQDRGGCGIYQFFVKDNRMYSTTYDINVPWTNKQLDISYETFRDKTLPGSEEKWKVKISGNKGEKVAAEMLAGMYDASLDRFKPYNWNIPAIWPDFNVYNGWAGVANFNSVQSIEKWQNENYVQQNEKRYDALLFADEEYTIKRDIAGSVASITAGVKIKNLSKGYRLSSPQMSSQQFAPPKIVKDEEIVQGIPDYGLVAPPVKDETKTDQSQIQIRKNFNETAFFFPELRTDNEGNIEFSFTMPEALTQWKLMMLAHTKDLAFGYSEKMVVTQKQLMVQPNAPRFVREGDSMEFSAKIVNLDTVMVNGQAQLQLLNASTMQPVDSRFKNNNPIQNFSTPAGQSSLVKFNIIIPAGYNEALVYRIVAKSSINSRGNADISDGEEAAIPVLTNRMLVTETMPLPVKSNQTKKFTFEKLLHSGNSNTLTNHALTIEFTTNPAWYAVQALPYLMEYPYECAEQTFNRYYANSLATKIVNVSPAIKAVFQKWKDADTSALFSNLQKNEELKSVLLQETPWVLEAKDENLQKKNIALLFDMVRMNTELGSSLAKLKDMQAPDGGFVWFKGGPDDRYITQYILTGIGHLKKLNAVSKDQDQKLSPVINAALSYLDKKIQEDYDNLKKYKANLKSGNSSDISIQYLYMRSFFIDHPVPKETQAAYNYFLAQSKKSWLLQRKFMQAMIAVFLYRNDDKITPQAIVNSLKENAINSEELGMYWKEFNEGGYWWYQAPVESQAMMIEAFTEIDKDVKVIDDLKTWLLKNKQTNNWHTTKATADACYALLLQGTDWLSEEKNVIVTLGDTTISSKTENREAGTGYFKTKISEDKLKPAMGNINVSFSAGEHNKVTPLQSETAWGAVYWQYFEDLDKITFSETPLKLSKKLFIERNTDKGPVLYPLANGENSDGVKIGDKIKVRIELRVDRDMEYVHMKDMRASCMEPTNVISEYKYQDGLGYYETTKDASTSFFFNYLPKGTYVFEYRVFVTNKGNFSNGVTTIQCMYAPEFTAHSEGVRVTVK